jgi:hypothetical protein
MCLRRSRGRNCSGARRLPHSDGLHPSDLARSQPTRRPRARSPLSPLNSITSVPITRERHLNRRMRNVRFRPPCIAAHYLHREGVVHNHLIAGTRTPVSIAPEYVRLRLTMARGFQHGRANRSGQASEQHTRRHGQGCGVQDCTGGGDSEQHGGSGMLAHRKFSINIRSELSFTLRRW